MEAGLSLEVLRTRASLLGTAEEAELAVEKEEDGVEDDNDEDDEDDEEDEEDEYDDEEEEDEEEDEEEEVRGDDGSLAMPTVTESSSPTICPPPPGFSIDCLLSVYASSAAKPQASRGRPPPSPALIVSPSPKETGLPVSPHRLGSPQRQIAGPRPTSDHSHWPRLGGLVLDRVTSQAAVGRRRDHLNDMTPSNMGVVKATAIDVAVVVGVSQNATRLTNSSVSPESVSKAYEDDENNDEMEINDLSKLSVLNPDRGEVMADQLFEEKLKTGKPAVLSPSGWPG
ncbi:unnamed protein product [Protopolystoma xenopodis]|uniref:Uncharacterized protein n=1 Tax=Protopolystoma xenopodis TaxID=117903 RepID=A0A448WEJ4_9PLAT|nr:unnamed protein product [Protopolystoma xenopodis]